MIRVVCECYGDCHLQVSDTLHFSRPCSAQSASDPADLATPDSTLHIFAPLLVDCCAHLPALQSLAVSRQGSHGLGLAKHWPPVLIGSSLSELYSPFSNRGYRVLIFVPNRYIFLFNSGSFYRVASFDAKVSHDCD